MQRLFVWTVSMVGIVVMMSSCQNRNASEARSPGERAFRARCAVCHRLPAPSDQTDEQWPTFLEEHAERAGLSDEHVKMISTHLTNSN